jgi:hypothetical protein
MGKEARYLWGKTKMDQVSVKYIDFRGQSSAPTFKNGRMYMDTDYNLKVGNDGSTFMTVTTS